MRQAAMAFLMSAAVISVGAGGGAGKGTAMTTIVEQGKTLEQNKATARRWSEELWGRGNLAVADEIVAADYVRHDPGDPFPARGPQDVKRIVTMLRGMLPDLQIRVDAVVAEGDLVVTRYSTTATDTVGYMGQPPTGRTIHATAMQMFRFADGRIVESWAVRDDLGVLRQLGRIPAAPPRHE